MNYALAICHLGDRILGGPPFIQPFPGSERALTLAEVQEMQTRLTKAGFDTGGTDGRVGNDTMKAIKDFQNKMGLSAGRRLWRPESAGAAAAGVWVRSGHCRRRQQTRCRFRRPLPQIHLMLEIPMRFRPGDHRSRLRFCSATLSARRLCARYFPTRRWSAAMSRSRLRWQRPRQNAASFPSMRPRRSRSCTDASALDFDLLRQETDNVGYPILPLVHQMAKQCGEAGRYVHWGATTQDIMDTAVVLQLREGLSIVEQRYRGVAPILADLSRRHRDTPMAGRTHLQQALPITFGYKTSIWLAMFDRHAERLQQLKPRVLVGQFAGAAGTLASLGDKGFEVQQALCEELGLGVPASTWHVARDGFAEAVNFLALVTGSLGKIALDIMIMASTEFAEVYEPFVKGRGASSTMPQKRNPISRELMLAASKAVSPACRPDARCR